MNAETKIVVLERAILKLTSDLAFTLRHLADIEEIRESDKARMRATAAGLDQLSDTLQG